MLLFYSIIQAQYYRLLWDCGTRPRDTIKTTTFRQFHGTICIVKVFLLSERGINRNYTGIFLDFFNRFNRKVAVKSEWGGPPLVALWSGPWQSANLT